MKSYNFCHLDWDTSFFKIKCGKITLYNSLDVFEWQELFSNLNTYQLLYIEDKSSSYSNNRLINQLDLAYIVDINIQFEKHNLSEKQPCNNIEIIEALPPLNDLFRISNFKYSRFIEDNELKLIGGESVYDEWLQNSFSQKGKFFSIFKNEINILGYVLFSFNKNTCIIELIAVDENAQGRNIGKKLFDSVNNYALLQGADLIKVGTQLKNIKAINFYHSLGCIQTESSTIYHYWIKK